MRVGFNPNKDKVIMECKYLHRIIIPVYVSKGKYKRDLLKILQFTLNSLYKTIHSRTAITVVNNGSNSEVVNFLNEEFKNKKIQELIHTNNIGKLNSILKVLPSVTEEIVTISDADVLFLNGWQDETIKIFNAFPKAGIVGIVPQFKLYEVNSFNVLFDKFWSSKLRFTPVINPKALECFYTSIGWDNNYNKDYLKTNLTLESNNGVKSLVGSGHFVATYRNKVFEYLPKENSKYLLGGFSEQKFLDTPILKVGGWRLTTNNNYAYHLGNTTENWMSVVLENLQDESNRECLSINKSNLKKNRLGFFVKNHLFRKLLSNKFIFIKFLIFKKLDRNIAAKY